jgi:hypothetical protein
VQKELGPRGDIGLVKRFNLGMLRFCYPSEFHYVEDWIVSSNSIQKFSQLPRQSRKYSASRF